MTWDLQTRTMGDWDRAEHYPMPAEQVACGDTYRWSPFPCPKCGTENYLASHGSKTQCPGCEAHLAVFGA